MVGDPELGGADPAAVLARAAAVFPVLAERDEQRELVLHRLHVRGPAERAPGEAVGVHPVAVRPGALALGVDRTCT